MPRVPTVTESWSDEARRILVSVVRHLESVATYPELRAAYNAVQPPVSAFYSGIPLNDGLWRAIKKLAADRDPVLVVLNADTEQLQLASRTRITSLVLDLMTTGSAVANVKRVQP